MCYALQMNGINVICSESLDASNKQPKESILYMVFRAQYMTVYLELVLSFELRELTLLS